MISKLFQNVKKRLPNSWVSIGLGFSLLCLTLRALEKILSTYTGSYQQDPLKHNIYSYTSSDFIELLHQIKGLFQPVLDFALRRYLVFPIFGFDERSFRILSAICFVLALWAVPLITYTFLKREGHSPAVSVVAGIGSAFWVLGNKALLAQAVEGRHYMAAGLVSIAWFACVFLFESKPRWVFFLLSLLFANAHFFSFPLIATGFGIELFRSYRERNWKDIRTLVLAGTAILAVTVAINYPAFANLMGQPPGAKHNSLWSQLPAAKDLCLRFLKLLDLPLQWPVILLAVIGALVPLKRVGFLLISGIVFPLFLAYMRAKSDYPISDRYYLPFFGFGIITIAYGVDALLRGLQYLARRTQLPRAELLPLVAICVTMAWTFPSKDMARTFTDLRQLKIPPRHFTAGYKYYRQLLKLPSEKLVIYKHHQPGGRHVPNFYLMVDRPPDTPEVQVIPTHKKSFPKNRDDVREFWSKHQNATVIFDWPRKCVANPTDNQRVFKGIGRCSLAVPEVKNMEEFDALMRKFRVKLKG